MIEIIPAIDIIDGKCVRLSQGNYNAKSVYSESPLEMAKKLEDIGIKRLHMVDLDGARTGKIANLHVLETVAKDTSLLIDFGGGIRTSTDVDAVLKAGAFKISLSSIVIREPKTFASWIGQYGSDNILLGADVKDERIRIDGWKGGTTLNLFDFIRNNIALGIHHFFCTDIEKDGCWKGLRMICTAVSGRHFRASI